MNKRRVPRLAATAALVAATVGSAIAAQPASAAAAPVGVTDWNDCPSGRICVWSEPYAEGDWASFTPVTPGSCKKPIFLDTFRSTWNRTSVKQRIWSTSNCTFGSLITLNPGQLLGNHGPMRSVGAYP